MENKVKRKEAIELLGIDLKTFDNYFKFADEFSSLPRNNGRGLFYFDPAELLKWKESYHWRTVKLNMEDYSLCLDFALAQHFRGYVSSDFGSGRQREFGQKITNWVKGQLAEVAVKKFLNEKFNIDVKLDFEIYNKIVPQDIIGVIQGTEYREPKIGIGIKASKPKNAYLVLSENEVNIHDRKSDVYIFCRPDIPDDHLLRIAKTEIIKCVEKQQHYTKYASDIPKFECINCEIAGWCEVNELERVEEIPGQEFNGSRLVKKSGLLHKDKKSWEGLIKRI